MKQTTSHAEKEKFWRQQMAMSKKFPGSHGDFCKAQGISIHSFMYWQRKLVIENRQVKSLVPSPFVQVVVEKPQPAVQQRALPDAVWLAEFILRLQAGLR